MYFALDYAYSDVADVKLNLLAQLLNRIPSTRPSPLSYLPLAIAITLWILKYTPGTDHEQGHACKCAIVLYMHMQT